MVSRSAGEFFPIRFSPLPRVDQESKVAATTRRFRLAGLLIADLSIDSHNRRGLSWMTVQSLEDRLVKFPISQHRRNARRLLRALRH